MEAEQYESACQKGTKQALEEFVKAYPDGRHSEEAKGKIEDYDLWLKAQSANTIDGYNEYIQKSKNKSFEKQANDAIIELKAEGEWNNLKTSTSIAELQGFIVKYPQSTKALTAQNRIHELKGLQHYQNGSLSEAYNEFVMAGGRSALETPNRSKFDECEEYVDFSKLSLYASERELLSFLQHHPSGKYSDTVSNRIAISKAKNLTMYSSYSQFNEALSYAKDGTTRAMVQQYINNSKKEYATYQKHQRRNARTQKAKRNGGYVQFGIEIMDFAWNCVSLDRYLNVFYYNVGLSMKIGNYKSPVQLEFGLKPGILCSYEADDDWHYYYGYYDKDVQVGFHMPIYTKLKINICNSGMYSKFYVAGMGYYNAVRDKELENQFSAGCGAGFAWRHWDMLFYYKQDLNNKHHLDDKYIGSSVVYYF